MRRIARVSLLEGIALMEGIHQLVRKDLQSEIIQMLSVISITLIICSTITII